MKADDLTHQGWTYAVVYVDRMRDYHKGIVGRVGGLDETETRIARKHWKTAGAGMKEALRHAAARFERDGDTDHVRVVEIPPNEPHDFDGNIVMDIKIGRGQV